MGLEGFYNRQYKGSRRVTIRILYGFWKGYSEGLRWGLGFRVLQV